MPRDFVDPISGANPFDIRPDAEHPNVILITMDMVPLEFYRQADDAVRPHTPNLDALRAEGISFSRAFSTSPLCSPSRASYLSGRYSYITTNSERSHDGHAIHLREGDAIFPAYLKAAGYHTRHVGKSHVGTQAFMDVFGENDAPWNRWSPPWYDEDAYVAHLADLGFKRFTFEREVQGRDASGEGPGNSYGGWIAPQDGRPFPKEGTYPAFLVERAKRALRTRADGEQPFYLQLDFFGPHQPFAIPAGYEAREAELREQVELPDSYRDWLAHDYVSPGNEPRVYRVYRRYWGLRDPEAAKEYMIGNLLQFELLDEMVGELLQYLRDAGLYDETWIVFCADHGEMNCESALIDKGAYLNPRTIGVPLVLKPPMARAQGLAGRVVEQPVSLLDLAPTILDLCGLQSTARMDGVSLFLRAEGMPRPPEKPILCEIWSHVVPNPAIGMVFRASDGGFSMYTYNMTSDWDELYALDGAVRPRNLIGDPGARGLLREARLAMDAALQADERWRGYAAAFRLEYAEALERRVGDSQKFEGA